MKNSKAGRIPLFVVIFCAQLSLNSSWITSVKLGVVFYSSLGLALLLILRRTIVRQSFKVVSFLLIMSFVGALSALKNGSFLAVSSYAALLAFFAGSFGWFSVQRDREEMARELVVVFAVSSAFFIILSLFGESFTLYRYQGFFNNPNSMGWFSAAVVTLLGTALLSRYFYWGKFLKVFLFAVFLSASAFLVASNSRGALVSVVTGFLALSSAELFRIAVRRKVLRSSMFRVSFFLLVVVVVVGTLFQAGVFDPIFHKFVVKAKTGDVTGSRFDIWAAILREWTWLGLGSDYAYLISREGDFVGHSTYMNQLAKFGLLPALSFFVFLLYAVCRGFAGVVKEDGAVFSILLVASATFMANAFFESGASTPGMWVTLFLLFASFKRLGRSASNVTGP